MFVNYKWLLIHGWCNVHLKMSGLLCVSEIGFNQHLTVSSFFCGICIIFHFQFISANNKIIDTTLKSSMVNMGFGGMGGGKVNCTAF